MASCSRRACYCALVCKLPHVSLLLVCSTESDMPVAWGSAAALVAGPDMPVWASAQTKCRRGWTWRS